MAPNNNSQHQLAECLHLLADIIATGEPDDIFTVLEDALRTAKKEISSSTKRTDTRKRSSPQSRVGSTVPAQESIGLQKDNSALSVKEFGRDVTSDVEFPTRRDLFDFAIAQGLQVSERDTKAAIRKRLLGKAELRNMDELVGQNREK